jgi:hypothetical protein
LSVGRAKDFALVGPLGAARRSIIMLVMILGYLAETQIVDLGGIVGFPAGGPNHRADFEVQGFGFHVQIDGIVFAGFLAFGIIGADDFGAK